MAFVPSRNLFNTSNDTLRDYQHASRAFVDDQFALAPKHKFTYHIVFGLNREALTDASLYQVHKNEISLLVKSVDLPSFDIKTETLHQYNRKKNVQYRQDYKPVTILFHDDNLGLINTLWHNYYSYYYADPWSATNPGAYKRNATRSFDHVSNNYGLDNGSTIPFFSSVKMYQMARHEYVCYTLHNPLISSWNHNKLSYSDNATHDNSMTLMYEAVSYSYGNVDNVEAQVPEGFAQGRYDNTPSTLQGNRIQGKASSSFVESSALRNNAENILGNVIESINSYQNTNNINQPANSLLINTQPISSPNNGISNAVFPRVENPESTTVANQKTF